VKRERVAAGFARAIATAKRTGEDMAGLEALWDEVGRMGLRREVEALLVHLSDEKQEARQ